MYWSSSRISLPLPDDGPFGPGGAITIERVRGLDLVELDGLMRSTALVQFVVIDAATSAPRWIAIHQTTAFWERQARGRLSSGEWTASEWRGPAQGLLVLLESSPGDSHVAPRPAAVDR